MTFKYEHKKMREGYTRIIGCDEVGRGCLAGPVVAAAVIMKLETWSMRREIKDSKLLNANKREELSELIKQHALAWSLGEVSSDIVDKMNIHNASLLAMRLAVESLPQNDRGFLCVDGKFRVPGIDMAQEAVVEGDNKILSVAAASIIAKVYRDGLMIGLHQKYPIYNFAQHKGYATFYHRKMVKRHGLSAIHRLSFCEHLTA